MKLSLPIQKQIIDNNPDSIIVTNKSGDIEYANKAAQQIYGYHFEELTGKNVSIFNLCPFMLKNSFLLAFMIKVNLVFK